jgi:AcrR family transcriptional regulator
MRKDATRNRERLLQAARALFAEHGLEVPLEEVARTAGVSIGTLYNRFPTRGALVDAVFADRIAAVRALAEQALATDDAWQGFSKFLTGVCELQAADLGYNDLALGAVPQAPATEQARVEGYGLMRRIVERAQQAGALRADIALEDLVFVLWGHAATVRATRHLQPDAWRRHLALALDGLRAAAAHPLPGRPFTLAQARAALGEGP